MVKKPKTPTNEEIWVSLRTLADEILDKRVTFSFDERSLCSLEDIKARTGQGFDEIEVRDPDET